MGAEGVMIFIFLLLPEMVNTLILPLRAIMVEQCIEKPALFLWLEGVTFHWFLVGYKFNTILT